MAERGVVRVQVHIEGVFVVQWVVLPAQLDVGHLQRVADGLDGIGAGALGWPKDRHHPQCQLVTGCNRKREGGTVQGSVLSHQASGHWGQGSSDLENPLRWATEELSEPQFPHLETGVVIAPTLENHREVE